MRISLSAFLLIVLCISLMLIPVNPPMPYSNELTIKQSILQEDINKTSQICLTQCHHALTDTLQQAVKLHEQRQGNNLSHEAIRELLTELQQKHPHMLELTWIDPSQQLKDGMRSGRLDANLQRLSAPAKHDALQFLRRQQRERQYRSPELKHDQESYAVIGASIQDEGPYLIAFVHQGLLREIAVEQRKNLRIVPFPSDKRLNIQSVDADTMRPMKVHHAEDNEGTSHYHTRQVVVKFKMPPTKKQLSQIKKETAAAAIHHIDSTYIFHSDRMSALQLIEYFQQWEIEYCEPHFMYLTNAIHNVQPFNLLTEQMLMPNVHKLFQAHRNQEQESHHQDRLQQEQLSGKLNQQEQIIPNDALFERYQWNLPMIETLYGWNISKGSENIVVAVIDTGVDLDHPELSGRVVSGLNVMDDTALPYDDVGHGTHVAGIIAAGVNNNEGIAGMSWYNMVMPIKALDHTGAGSTYSVAQGIIWAADHGAKVINMSLGNYVNSEFLHDAIRYAFERDVLLVAAAGNDHTSDPGYPAAYPEVLAVAAITAQQQTAAFSNYGQYIDVTAPGEHIASTYPGYQYAALSGTSMASPHVAALAALIRTANPQLSNIEVMEIICNTAVDLGEKGHDPYYGYGQIDVKRALEQTVWNM